MEPLRTAGKGPRDRLGASVQKASGSAPLYRGQASLAVRETLPHMRNRSSGRHPRPPHVPASLCLALGARLPQALREGSSGTDNIELR